MAVQTTEEFKNGGATSYSITIEYLKESDIKVRIDGALQDYVFDFDAANKQFTSRFALNPSLFNRPPQTVGFTPFSSFRPFNT